MGRLPPPTYAQAVSSPPAPPPPPDAVPSPDSGSSIQSESEHLAAEAAQPPESTSLMSRIAKIWYRPVDGGSPQSSGTIGRSARLENDQVPVDTEPLIFESHP